MRFFLYKENKVNKHIRELINKDSYVWVNKINYPVLSIDSDKLKKGFNWVKPDNSLRNLAEDTWE